MPKIHCIVKGISPYYFNRQVEGPVPKTIEQQVQRALDLVYCTGEEENSFKVSDINGSYTVRNGNLYMPGNQFRGCMRSAMSLFKMKIEKSNKRAIDLLNASVFIEPHWVEFESSKKGKNGFTMKDVKIDAHWIVLDSIKGTGATKYFSCLEPEWTAEFNIEHMGLFDLSFLETSLVNGGLYCGIGGRRIHRNGRFEVQEFK